MIETVRVSAEAKDQLLTLKRRTGIMQWNILCRWALMRSLAEPTRPAKVPVGGESSVEMSWRTFAGPEHELIAALVRQRCAKDGVSLDDSVVAEQFRLHLHRGIAYLFGDRTIDSVEALVKLGLPARDAA